MESLHFNEEIVVENWKLKTIDSKQILSIQNFHFQFHEEWPKWNFTSEFKIIHLEY